MDEQERVRKERNRHHECVLCGVRINGDDAAVDGPFLAGKEFFDTVNYVPFTEDRRSGGDLAHPLCFINEYGADAFVQLVHKHDRSWRGEDHRLGDEVRRLKAQLREERRR